MAKVGISIGDKKYKVSLARTDEEKEKGLQNIENLPKDEGMLFIFEKPTETSFWMKDTKIPLDIVFIDDDLVVKAIHKGVPESEDFMTEDGISYVLEVNPDSGIKEKDELDFSPNAKIKSDKMHVLDSNGDSQAELAGGERIFSRGNTKTLIKFAKKAATMGNDKDYKALGARLFKFIRIQNENDPEYVQLKEK